MIKYFDFYPEDTNVEFTLIHPGHMIKTAEYDDGLKEVIKNIEAKQGKYYLLVNALGAGEYYGSNRNGDYFPEKALI